MEAIEPYNDLTPMPFGKFRGTPLANVDAEYLLWLYGTSENGSRLSDAKLAKYIESNMESLRIESVSARQKRFYERR